jgi:hypothetical protein
MFERLAYNDDNVCKIRNNIRNIFITKKIT